jgi:thiamine biosynthesis protein ThiC
MKLVGNVACMGDMRNAYKSPVRKPEGKIAHARPRHRWEDTLKLSIKKQSGRKWIESSDSGQETVLNSYEHSGSTRGRKSD